MRIKMFGNGHITDHPKRMPRMIAPSRIASFRRGGLGDGLLNTCLLTAVGREFQGASIDGFADETFFELMRKHPACSSVIQVPWSRGMAMETDVRRSHAQSYDLWYDTKPVPMVDGKMASSHCDTEVRERLAEVERRYYHFNADEIISLYQEMGCRGQMQMLTKLVGFEVRIQDAFVQRSPIPTGVRLPSAYITVSAGYTNTSDYKSWPSDRWKIVGAWLSSCGICPIQVGSPSEDRIDGFLPMMNLSMNQQFELMAGAMCHVGSDGFLCHVSSALDVPTIVLWGPTPPSVWGHVGQMDVVAPRARNIWWTHYHWGRSSECREMMGRIEPDSVSDAIEVMLERNDVVMKNPRFGMRRTPCRVVKVEGGFGDGLMAMSMLKSLISKGDRVFVFVSPDGDGKTENVRRCCEMFSFVDGVFVMEEDHLHGQSDASRVMRERVGGDFRVDSYLDLRFGSILSAGGHFSTLDLSDLKHVPDLPEWLPKGPSCCLQPSTRQNVGKDAMWDGYEEAMRVIEDEMGIPVILIGGPSDEDRVTAIPRLGVNAVGRLSFEEAFVLCASTPSISMDSWIAHCSGSFGNRAVYIAQDDTLREFLRFVDSYGGTRVMAREASPRVVAGMMGGIDGGAAIGDVISKALGLSCMGKEQMLRLYDSCMAVRDVPGDVAELGVYRGGSSFLIANLMPGRRFHVFDTFDGMPASMSSEHEEFRAGMFGDADEKAVRDLLAPFDDVSLHVGMFPDTASEIDGTFAFAHFDGDMYECAMAFFEFFLPKMSDGGVIVIDDYGHPEWPGVKVAADEFFLGRGMEIELLAPAQARVFVRRVR